MTAGSGLAVLAIRPAMVAARRPALILAACLLTWLALVARMAPKLPVVPALSGDSLSYLTQASYRPPLYGWLLVAYQSLVGSTDYLPLLQYMLVALGLLLFAVEIGRLLDSLWAGPLAILLVLLHVFSHEAPRQVLSEALYLAVILAGLGLQLRFARRGEVLALAAAAACFALAAITRSTGMAYLILPLLAVLFDPRLRWRAALARGAVAMGVAALILLGAMAGNAARHGHFEIGSWTGMAVLGKGLLVLEETDADVLPPLTGAIAPEAARLRSLTSAQPDLAAIMRAQMQSSEDLRFALFFIMAEDQWPAWHNAGWRERGKLALAVGQELVLRHPIPFLKTVARDWGSLVLYPMHWPAWATTEPEDKLVFPVCRLHDNCWAVTRYGIPVPSLVAMLAASLAGAVGGAVLLVAGLRRVLRRTATPRFLAFWAIAALLHLSLLASAAMESGIVRYTIGLHPLSVALLLFLLHEAWRRLRGAR